LISPVFDYDVRSREITYGYRLRVRNLAGMNQSFRSDGRLGRGDAVSVSWETPWLGAERRALFVSARAELPQEGVDELRSSQISLASTRFLGDYRKRRSGIVTFGRLEMIERDATHPQGGLNELIPAIGSGWFRDTRNLRIDPERGSVLGLTMEYSTDWTHDDVSYLRAFTDVRKFVSLGTRFIVAARGVSVLTTGEVPDYRRVGVGGGSSIRGQVSDVAVGDNLGRGSVELRFHLLGKRRLNLPIPLAPRRLRNFDLRIDGVLFADGGSAWGNGVPLRDARLRKGFGVGLRIFLPVLEVARIELAFDEDGSPTLYFREGNFL
jgi:outer membrane protein assembly factor BamA